MNVLNKPKEDVLLKLLYSNCVPILTYACDVKKFNSREMSQCNIAINDAIRKIFTFNRWESVRYVRESFGYPSIYEIFVSREKRFLSSLQTANNRVLSHLYNVYNLE